MLLSFDNIDTKMIQIKNEKQINKGKKNETIQNKKDYNKVIFFKYN